MFFKNLNSKKINYHKIWIIAKREVVEKTATRYFYIFSLIFPLIIVLLGLFFSDAKVIDKRKISIALFIQKNIAFKNQIYLQKNIKDIEDVLNVEFEIIEETNSYWSSNLINLLEKDFLDGAINIDKRENKYLVDVFYKNEKTKSPIMAAGEFLALKMLHIKDLEVKETKIKINSNEKNIPSPKFSFEFVSAYFFAIFFTTLVLSAGSMIARTFLYEKNYKIIELFNSSCNIDEIILGKIAGNFLIGLLNTSIMTMLIVSVFFLIGEKISYLTLILQLIFFLLGYLFYASMFVAASVAIDSDQGAYQFSALSALILIITFSLMEFLSKSSFGKIFLIVFPSANALYVIMMTGFGAIRQSEAFAAFLSLAYWSLFCVWIAKRIYRLKITGGLEKITLRQILFSKFL